MFKNVFGSGFLVRTSHVILTWVITLILFLHDTGESVAALRHYSPSCFVWVGMYTAGSCVCVCVCGGAPQRHFSMYYPDCPTELRKQEETGQLIQPVLFVLLVLLSVLLYFAVSLMDPGFILSDDTDLQFMLGVTEEQQDMIPPTTKSLRQRRCGRCLLQQPMRSKHCQTCQHCVRRYDHHCPWIENCVGERNHRWFVLYLAFQLLVLLWGLHIAWTGFSYAPVWQLWLRTNGVLLVVAVLLVLLSLIVLLLLGSHLYLVSLNTTTWEFMSRHRISYLKHCGADENPFDRGTFHNLWGFFCVWGTVVWEQVYFREGSDQV